MQREIRVLVRVLVEECDPADIEIDRETTEDAAVEAIENAVKSAENNGFSHTYADELSMHVVGVSAYEACDENPDDDPDHPDGCDDDDDDWSLEDQLRRE